MAIVDRTDYRPTGRPDKILHRRVHFSMRRSVAVLAVAVAMAVGPALFLVWLRVRTEDRMQALQPMPAPVVVAVEETEIANAQAVTLRLEWGDAQILPAPQWTGVVTEVAAHPGNSLKTGDRVVTIDGIDRISAHTPMPFWRPLEFGDRGPDVAQLWDLLSELGFVAAGDEQPSSLDWAMVLGVQELADSLGVGSRVQAFDPAWVVWLPTDRFFVRGVNVRVGDPAPALGEAIATGPDPLIDVVLTDSQETTVQLRGEWIVQIDEERFDVIDDELSEEARRAIEDIYPLEETLAGSAALLAPVRVIQVAARAIWTNPSGETCVWVRSAGAYVPIPVQVTRGRSSLVNIVNGVQEGEEVLLNPDAVLEDPTCP